MIQVWSCGGGTQSAAIAVLIIQGKLPKPDISLIVDTNREKSSTWAYMDSVLKPELAKVGVDIVRVDRKEFATCDLFPTSGADYPLLPMYSSRKQEMSKLSAYCSAEWKRDVSARYLRSIGVEQATNWIGISLDEMNRVRTPRQKWLQLRYPLIFDVPMRRQDCIALVLEMGWPEPPRSACYMCPNHRNAGWLDMKVNWPDDFRRAVELEREIRQRDPDAWLHESCVPLDQVDFTTQQTTFFDNGCASGYCGN